MQVNKQLRTYPSTKLLIIGFSVLVSCALAWNWYSSTHPLSNRQYGFQYYQPTKLPAGFSTDAKRIDISTPDGKLIGIHAELKFTGVKNWIYTISETKAAPSYTIDMSRHNYDPSSKGFTCQRQVSAARQAYRLCHSVDFGTVNVFWVDFIRGNTAISTKFPGKLGQTISVSQLNDYVDSFQKAKASGFTLLSGGI